MLKTTLSYTVCMYVQISVNRVDRGKGEVCRCQRINCYLGNHQLGLQWFQLSFQVGCVLSLATKVWRLATSCFQGGPELGGNLQIFFGFGQCLLQHFYSPFLLHYNTCFCLPLIPQTLKLLQKLQNVQQINRTTLKQEV